MSKTQIKYEDVDWKHRYVLEHGTCHDLALKTLECDPLGNLYVTVRNQDVLSTKSAQKAVATFNSY